MSRRRDWGSSPRMSKKSQAFVFTYALIILLLPLYIVWKIVEYFLNKSKQDEKLKFLTEKYASSELVQNDPELIKKLHEGCYWVGQSAEMLRESLGDPSDVSQKVLKTKTKETWKYFRRTRSRYGLIITLENGVVVGWDEK